MIFRYIALSSAGRTLGCAHGLTRCFVACLGSRYISIAGAAQSLQARLVELGGLANTDAINAARSEAAADAMAEYKSTPAKVQAAVKKVRNSCSQPVQVLRECFQCVLVAGQPTYCGHGLRMLFRLALR